MNPQLWSWALAAIGIAGIFLAGRRTRPWIGWTIGLAAQLLWVAYALATRQYGFLASAAGYGTVYALNVRRALTARRPVLVTQVNVAHAVGAGSTAIAGARITRAARAGVIDA